MRIVLATGLILCLVSGVSAAPPDAAGLDHFEKRIRPLFLEHCSKCHSREAESGGKLKGGLRLDARETLLKGGDSGPAIVPGKPADSLLLKSLKYDGDLKMPPKGKLTNEQIADVEKWIAMGAPDPRTESGSARKPMGMSIEEGRKFWSYQPMQRPAVPIVRNTSWPVNEIDRFVLHRIESKNLTPAPAADKATLIRRVTFDLTGLPATVAEVDAFVRDADPKAYEKLIDRLLASPAFGERLGRHWLDVARYADSVTLRGFVYKDAWRYRDYVIDSFNRDVPFRQFVREQIAGDLLPAPSPEDKARQLVATTYLMLGNTNLEEQDKKQLRMDVVDEQLDVISKGLLGQTITCARCHDHKFDPIPTKDYYAMASILRNVKVMEHANVSAWTEVPLPVDATTEKKLSEKEKAIAALQDRIKAAKAIASKNGTAKSAILPLAEAPGIAIDDTQARKVGAWQNSTHSGHYIGTGYTHDQNAEKGQKTITFSPALPADGRYEVRLAYSPGGNRATNVPVTVFSADGEKEFTVDMKKTPPVDNRWISLGTYRFEKAGQSFVLIANEGTNGHVTPDCVTFIAVDAVPAATTDAGKGKPKASPSPAGDDIARMEAELKKLQATGPVRPKAMAPIEEKAIEEIKVHIRGSVHTLGEPAPRGVLKVSLTGTAPDFPKDQSGRIQLADWIAAPDNPHTARVFVNRVWHWIFGSGLVRTVDNFGTTGETPSHPELLDHLATKFIDQGGSVKKLIREILLSQTYRQQTITDPQSPIVKADPENRLFARANRKRLEAEAIRDTMLAVSGRLDPKRGGPDFPASQTADYGFVTQSLRRSIYLPMFRNAMPKLLEVFDMADPSLVTGQRTTSTVAPQALFLLNDAFVVETATATAKVILAEPSATADQRLQTTYRRILGRLPTEGERAAAMRYLTAHGADRIETWSGLVHALFASADFRFIE